MQQHPLEMVTYPPQPGETVLALELKIVLPAAKFKV